MLKVNQSQITALFFYLGTQNKDMNVKASQAPIYRSMFV